MRAIKKINNNVAICIDQKEMNLLLLERNQFQVPCEISDLNRIRRTFTTLMKNIYHSCQKSIRICLKSVSRLLTMREYITEEFNQSSFNFLLWII